MIDDIVRSDNLIRLKDTCPAPVCDWLSDIYLTPEEAAAIQPTYELCRYGGFYCKTIDIPQPGPMQGFFLNLYDILFSFGPAIIGLFLSCLFYFCALKALSLLAGKRKIIYGGIAVSLLLPFVYCLSVFVPQFGFSRSGFYWRFLMQWERMFLGDGGHFRPDPDAFQIGSVLFLLIVFLSLAHACFSKKRTDSNLRLLPFIDVKKGIVAVLALAVIVSSSVMAVSGSGYISEGARLHKIKKTERANRPKSAWVLKEKYRWIYDDPQAVGMFGDVNEAYVQKKQEEIERAERNRKQEHVDE
ncbi:MAG: hypothetical protein KDJ75_04325 [Alphaproteobacteria bacterium]|nr:hypothetical protein [Alphaproteobacteria bacterium]